MIHTTDEWQSLEGLDLSPEQVRELAISDAFTIRPDATKPGSWIVTATQFVGMARFGDLEIHVRPKVGVHRLVELMCSALDRVSWRDEDTMWSESDDLVATIAATFATHAERVVQRGLLQGYRTIDDRLLGVRGRIAIGRQVARNPGLPIPVEVTYDDYTTDVVENQLLAGATQVLLRLPGLPAILRSRLRRLDQRFIDVHATPPSPAPPRLTWSRLNERYRSATTIARLVLRGAALDTDGAPVRVGSGLLVDMNKVFEDVVGQRIRFILEADGFRTVLQADHYLDAERTTKIRPDILVHSGDTPVAVADVKYKVLGDRLRTDDLFQAVTYARRFDLEQTTLIYAAPSPLSALTIGSTTVLVHHIDLAADPAERAERLAECARSLIAELSAL